MYRTLRPLTSWAQALTSFAQPLALLAGLTLVLVAATSASAQQAPASQPAATQTPPMVQFTAEEQAARQKVLDSRAWNDALQGWNDWLATQLIYTPEQVAQLKQQMAIGVQNLNAEQLQLYLNDLQQKLKLLAGPEAQQAHDWLANFLTAQKVYTPEQVRAQMPDVANMNAAQVQAALDDFAAHHASAVQAQRAFNQGRMLQVQGAVAANQQAQRNMNRDMDRTNVSAVPASTSPRNSHFSQYRPPVTPGYQQQQWFTINPYGGVSVMLNPKD